MAAAADVKEDVAPPLTADELSRATAVTAGKRCCDTGGALAAAPRNARAASVLARLLNIFAAVWFPLINGGKYSWGSSEIAAGTKWRGRSRPPHRARSPHTCTCPCVSREPARPCPRAPGGADGSAAGTRAFASADCRVHGNQRPSLQASNSRMRADGARPVHLLLPRPPARACRCGSCGDTVDMGKDDQVRCRTCGHRILYKTRLKRAVQYEAR